MRRGGPRQYAWCVQVCDWESCWSIGYFSTEEKANNRKKNYKLKKHPPHFEQKVNVFRIEIF